MIHRRDVSDITAQAERDLLAAHRLNAADLIATGTEAKVYLLDAEQVLKVYADPDGTQAARLQTLRGFYDRLDRDRVPYALPEIRSVEQHNPLLATRETLLPGRPMGEACDLTTPEAEALYLDAVTALGTLPPPGDAGPRMLLADPGTPGADPGLGWHPFLRRLLDARLKAVHDILSADVPHFATVVKDLRTLLDSEYIGPEAVVHGDLYPDNLLLTAGSVSAVIDFGTFTMTGDPLYDVAGACIYYRQYEADRLTVWRRLLDQAADRTPAGRRHLLRAYAEIIAILTCDLYPEGAKTIQATGHYQWAVTVLRDLGWSS
ncbi:aminoglycoside phosphotransferase family protein (plasmid) [Streptomyces sp. NBC_01216]|uniref:phosphotransferase family protein n=1 Tax=Streptomyces sp. NBC_01216 TaxID=2903778 RepID=UPI002E114911|nr:aminoglycoside phosphotransferase family protein [Streptomyces sp. NBC_01216]